MLFYSHKNLRAGLFYFSLLSFGVRVFTKIPKFCIGTCPIVNHVFTKGSIFHYRATVLDKKNLKCQNFHNKILPFKDSSFFNLLTEIQEKHKLYFYYQIWTLLFLVFSIALSEYFKIQEFLSLYVISIIILGMVIIVIFNYFRDQSLKTTVIFYNLDDEIKETYQKLFNAFQELKSCSRAWLINEQENTFENYEIKMKSDVSFIQRSIATINTKGFGQLSTNIFVPSIKTKQYSFYFLPDKIFIFDGSQFEAISYSDIVLVVENTNFIERYDVPSDAFVVDHTWQYANKSGKIDKRFKFNRKIPITHYSKLTFKVLSKDVAITLHLSRAYMGLEFSNMLKDMATFCKSSS